MFLDTVTDGYVSEDSQLSTRDNVIICHDAGSAVHLSYGMGFCFFLFLLYASLN